MGSAHCQGHDWAKMGVPQDVADAQKRWDEDSQILRMRGLGFTWKAITERFGMSLTRAHRRYNRAVWRDGKNYTSPVELWLMFDPNVAKAELDKVKRQLSEAHDMVRHARFRRDIDSDRVLCQRNEALAHLDRAQHEFRELLADRDRVIEDVRYLKGLCVKAGILPKPSPSAA